MFTSKLHPLIQLNPNPTVSQTFVDYQINRSSYIYTLPMSKMSNNYIQLVIFVTSHNRVSGQEVGQRTTNTKARFMVTTFCQFDLYGRKPVPKLKMTTKMLYNAKNIRLHECYLHISMYMYVTFTLCFLQRYRKLQEER